LYYADAGSKKRKLKIKGITPDNKFVIGNVFELVDGKGVHLADILYHFKESDLLVDWIEFLEKSIDHNWNIDNTLSKIKESLEDSYGKQYTEEVMIRLKYYIMRSYK
jgi:hypothetical protein